MDMARTVRIPAMACQHCLGRIERRLLTVGGVFSASGRINDKTVTIRWDDQRVSWPAIAAALSEAGYPPSD